HLLYSGSVPAFHPPGFTALAPAGRSAAGGIMEHVRPHGAPVRRLGLTFSPGTPGLSVAAAEYAVPLPARLGGAFSRAPGGAVVFSAVSRNWHTSTSTAAAAVGSATAICPGKCRRPVTAQSPDGHGDQHQRLAHCGSGQLASGLLYPGRFLSNPDA